MQGNILSMGIINYMNTHLEEVKENRTRIIDETFPQICNGRAELENLLERYVTALEQALAEAQTEKGIQDELPFVMIGSRVKVENSANNKKLEFLICESITKDSKESGATAISYLSPMGKALILKKLGEQATVKAPGGVFNYTVCSIQPCLMPAATKV
ncbi:GreA/GreB family elongation factor [Syntrophomonas erecta]